MRFAKLLAALALLGLSCLGASTASAHTIPLKNWCGTNTGGPISVAQFDFNGAQLQSLVTQTINSIQKMNDAEDAGLEVTPDNDGKCGIVDIDLLMGSGLRASTLRASDEWTQTNIAITLYCNQFQVQNPAYDVPMPYTPGGTAYNSLNHHTAYRISYGLKGSCMACPMQLAPITSGG